MLGRNFSLQPRAENRPNTRGKAAATPPLEYYNFVSAVQAMRHLVK